MKSYCPNSLCSNSKWNLYRSPKRRPVVKKGTFYRKSDQRYLQRYFCKSCGSHFSSQTLHPDFKMKRRDLHPKLIEHLSSGLSQRRAAKVFGVNLKTIARKLKILGSRAREDQHHWQEKFRKNPSHHVQFDDLETIEHTKCKPLSVTLSVHQKSREILGFQVSRMPAKGHLSRIALKKYGPRPDERSKGWNRMFKDLKGIVKPDAYFESDQNPHYPKPLFKHFKNATHLGFPGARGSIAGQGELKKLFFDPLFSINHTFAMLRANINRLFRKTWCTTKKIQGLIDHLAIFVQYYNQTLRSHPCTD